METASAIRRGTFPLLFFPFGFSAQAERSMGGQIPICAVTSADLSKYVKKPSHLALQTTWQRGQGRLPECVARAVLRYRAVDRDEIGQALAHCAVEYKREGSRAVR